MIINLIKNFHGKWNQGHRFLSENDILKYITLLIRRKITTRRLLCNIFDRFIIVPAGL